MTTLHRRQEMRERTGPSSAYGLTDEWRDSRHDLLTAAPRITPACVTNDCNQGRKECPTPRVCAYERNQHPEAAHAATYIGTDTKDARKQMDEGAGALLWPLGFALLMLVIYGWSLIASNWPRLAALLGL